LKLGYHRTIRASASRGNDPTKIFSGPLGIGYLPPKLNERARQSGDRRAPGLSALEKYESAAAVVLPITSQFAKMPE
jgi:hypothetical protein